MGDMPLFSIFLALLDLHDLLLRGYDSELESFVHLLKEYGWGNKQISEFIQASSCHTRYDSLIDPPIPEVGDRKEFENNQYRWRK